jgi:hypothetical protein
VVTFTDITDLEQFGALQDAAPQGALATDGQSVSAATAQNQ